MEESTSGLGGASAEAVRAHYDLSNDFYRLWLDRSMTYSCALWNGDDDLESAQRRKLDFHISQAECKAQGSLLDIGCGWGSLLERAVDTHRIERAVGLTLSEAQFKHIQSRKRSGIDAYLESWEDHSPAEPYDSIVCIGAIEHFVRPEMPSDTRIEIYRAFFSRCHAFLVKGGNVSVQTIAYGVGGFTGGAIASIFPESDLPRLYQLAQAAEGIFEIVQVHNHRSDYARTCREWLKRLRDSREEAGSIVGAQTVKHYERFLDAAARGFDTHVFCLYRILLRRIG